MLFNSHAFIYAFLPCSLVVYWIFRNNSKVDTANSWLIFISLVFYAWLYPPHLILIITSIISNYCLSLFISNADGKYFFSRRILITLAIVGNLFVLGYYKYLSFLLSFFIIPSGRIITDSPYILPLGISFFTFQQIAYLVSAYRDETKQYGFKDYCLFVSFFPQLIAGPIVKHGEFFPQLKAHCQKFALAGIVTGGSFFVIGLSKKVICADPLGEFVGKLFEVVEKGEQLGFFISWLGAIAYSLQIYFDFSGYSDMALGLAYMFGIVLPVNFNSPYRSKSIIEFWENWHITLTRFFREFLYFPLGGNRKGIINQYWNIFIVMILCGFWHGAGWNFIVWGGIHACLIIVNHMWRKINKINVHGRWKTFYLMASWCVTFITISMSWVVFRAVSLKHAITYLQCMVPRESSWILASENFKQLGSFDYPLFFYVMVLVFLLAVVVLFPNTQHIFSRAFFMKEKPDKGTRGHIFLLTPHLKWYPNIIWGFLVGALLFICTLGIFTETQFIYFRF